MFKKRGISPLIATVLLIGFTVALAAIVIMWGGSFVKKTTSQADTDAKKDVIFSSDVSLILRKADVSGNTINLLVENNGKIAIDKLNVKVYGANGIDNIITATGIPAYGVQNFPITYDITKTWQVDSVEALPIINLDGKSVTGSVNNKKKIDKNEVIPTGAILLLKFEEPSLSSTLRDVIDSSGSSNNGKAENGINTIFDPVRGSVGNFDGLNDYVNVLDKPQFKYTGGYMSISFWFKIKNSENNGGWLISKPSNKGAYNYGIYLPIASNTISFSWISSSKNIPISKNTWYNYIVTADSARNVKIYLNGQLTRSDTHSITSWTPAGGDLNLPLTIGTLYPEGSGWSGASTLSIDAQIDDVGIWNKVLTAQEVTNIYYSQKK